MRKYNSAINLIECDEVCWEYKENDDVKARGNMVKTYVNSYGYHVFEVFNEDTSLTYLFTVSSSKQEQVEKFKNLCENKALVSISGKVKMIDSKHKSRVFLKCNKGLIVKEMENEK